ncbi:hypothetical protein [Streptomyces sp. NPDC016845]|uniref:hypothetical protein n=1 Tax=Streptomyces sp. NPDC016845 TaxID=3364972 RepID=UPI00379C8559
MRFRTAVATGALALAATGLWSTPALADAPNPGPDTGNGNGTGTVVLSDEAYDRLLRADVDEPLLIATHPSYREAWLFCLRSAEHDHVERNAWGEGYVCIPDGAVQ